MLRQLLLLNLLFLEKELPGKTHYVGAETIVESSYDTYSCNCNINFLTLYTILLDIRLLENSVSSVTCKIQSVTDAK